MTIANENHSLNNREISNEFYFVYSWKMYIPKGERIFVYCTQVCTQKNRNCITFTI